MRKLGQIILENIWHPSVPYHIIIQINDVVFIKFLGLKVWCLFEGGVYCKFCNNCEFMVD